MTTFAPPQTPLQALQRRNFLLGSWPWRSMAYVLSTLVVVGTAGGLLFPLLIPLFITPVLLYEASQGVADPDVGILVALPLLGLAMLLVFGPVIALPVAELERWRLRLVGPPVRSGHRVPRGGGWAWLRTRATEAATWRELVYLLLLCGVFAPVSFAAVVLIQLGGGLFFLSVPLLAAGGETIALGTWQVTEPSEGAALVPVGAALLLLVPHSAAAVAGVHGALARALLGHRDTEELRAELTEVTRSRARLVDAFEAERRRIERDLHDGAQQRLVAHAMQLGLARMDAEPGSQAEASLATAHETAKQLIGELREIIHGIHPQLLADRGLPAALPELADRAGLPADVRVDLARRLPAHLEATAYFVVAEALTNVAKHAEAGSVWIRARLEGALLLVEVGDDGRGGADTRGGTGLTGLADRLAVMDGRMLLSSPPGGPTRLRAELPWKHSPPSE